MEEDELEFRDYFFREHHAHSWCPEAPKQPSQAPQRSSGKYDHVVYDIYIFPIGIQAFSC